MSLFARTGILGAAAASITLAIAGCGAAANDDYGVVEQCFCHAERQGPSQRRSAEKAPADEKVAVAQTRVAVPVVVPSTAEAVVSEDDSEPYEETKPVGVDDTIQALVPMPDEGEPREER